MYSSQANIIPITPLCPLFPQSSSSPNKEKVDESCFNLIWTWNPYHILRVIDDKGLPINGLNHKRSESMDREITWEMSAETEQRLQVLVHYWGFLRQLTFREGLGALYAWDLLAKPRIQCPKVRGSQSASWYSVIMRTRTENPLMMTHKDQERKGLPEYSTLYQITWSFA